jgi:hypothetical protein
MRKFIILSIPLAIIFFSAIGCYTILKHPTAEENNTSAGDYYQKDCVRCHTDYHEYPYGYFYGHYPDYWWSSPRWGQYYAYPWWWDNYWYKDDYYYIEDTSAIRTSQGEKEVRRDALRPPYTHDIVAPIGQGSATSSSNSDKGSGDSQTTNPSNNNDKKSDAQKENDGKKASRRGGREPNR